MAGENDGRRRRRDGGTPRGGQGRQGSAGSPRRSPPRRPITVTPGGELPRWVREEISRSTPKERREAALAELSAGLNAFSEERYRQAAASLRRAKALAPRAGTVRELLGLAEYRLEDWESSLRELRTYRRLTGRTEHMAVELDDLRALGRDDAVDKTWALFFELGGTREAEDEVRVVYASHLLDRGRVRDAWRVINPGRLVANASPSTVRRWAVGVRVAAAAGDAAAARRLLDAIRREEPDAEWLEELESLVE